MTELTLDAQQDGGAKPPRLGLAFSGGGLRASFFHIGMLAQMAERGILRHVEVISTVSGGSILGALYYVHVKKLLESKHDSEVTDQDYVAMVDTLSRDFLKATQTNIRMQAFSSFKANWLKRRKDYSTSDRLAELYNRLLYQAVLDNAGDPIEMRKLKIFPSQQMDFHPNRHNAGRQAKVPILVLNATTLNSGRNWRFTAQDMGEPPSHNNAIDKKSIRLKRPDSYDDIVPSQQDFPLGHAVAASACVPGLFPPLSITGLYQDEGKEIQVQLVDGGVHDNQGIGGLLDNGCTHFIVSDASQQMSEVLQPGTGRLAVLARANSIALDRVRTVVLENLDRVAKGMAGAVHFVSLRQGLGFRELFSNGPDGQPVHAPDETKPTTREDFGVDPKVQDLMSKVRTDLDAFSDVEAYSLMLDGYLVGGYGLKGKPETVPQFNWLFLKIKPWMEQPTEDYLEQMKVAKITFGKALYLIPWLRYLSIALLLGLLIIFGAKILAFLQTCITLLGVLLILLGWAIDKVLPRLAGVYEFVERLLSPWATFKRWLISTGVVLVGTVFIKLYLLLINPLFLRRGSFEALERQGTPTGTPPSQAGA